MSRYLMPPSNDGRHIAIQGGRLILQTWVHEVSGWRLTMDMSVVRTEDAAFSVNLDDHDLVQLHRMVAAAMVSKGLLKP